MGEDCVREVFRCYQPGSQRPRLITLNLITQASVAQRLDNAIQRISVNKTNHAIHWIVIYPVDSVIHNPGQVVRRGDLYISIRLYFFIYLHIAFFIDSFIL